MLAAKKSGDHHRGPPFPDRTFITKLPRHPFRLGLMRPFTVVAIELMPEVPFQSKIPQYLLEESTTGPSGPREVEILEMASGVPVDTSTQPKPRHQQGAGSGRWATTRGPE